MDEPNQILPAHIEDTIKAIARLQTRHEEEATLLERLVERITGAVGRPGFLLVLSCGVLGWVAVNLWGWMLGLHSFDPPPFNWLQGLLTLMALLVTVIILTTQRRADKLSSHREQLTLELSILAEQKASKVIELLEEIRSDNPLLKDRVNREAQEMAKPADPDAVLQALVNNAVSGPAAD